MTLVSTDRHQLNVHFTDWRYGFNMMHDCLYYNAVDDSLDYLPDWYQLSQIIAYCIRPESNNTSTFLPSIVNGNTYTFKELQLNQITSEQLYDWSAPIDLAERYQLYLYNSDELLSNQTFNNCSRPWFGQFCQFQFDEDRSLSDIVKVSFLSKKDPEERIVKLTNHTCYIHLNCSMGPQPLCLDWRDICDGKTDCMNNNADERDCVELETDICSKNEFQCRNGQCIPIEFFNNDRSNPYCLDGSDQQNLLACFEDPTMRCEDRSNAYILYSHGPTFHCGDGNHLPIGSNHDCENMRRSLFDRTIFSKANNPSITNECWLAMIDYFEVSDYIERSWDISAPCFGINNNCSQFIFVNCPSLFLFPSLPALFGHVYLYYSHNISIEESLKAISPPKPMYVCYNDQICPYVPWTIKINESTCRPFSELSNQSGWYDVIQDLANIFWSCSTNGISEEHCKNYGFYRCKNSSKCISNRRVVDGSVDCFDGSDEQNNYSCSVNDDLRFACTSEDKCLSHLMYLDGVPDCLHGEDEESPEDVMQNESVSFPMMCDGFIEINLAEYIRNQSTETDETNCDQWPCSNVYTRCDGFWNCKNGSDELNCPNLASVCPVNKFECVSSETFELICLPADRAGDGDVDCLGGSDERFYCRNDAPDATSVRYRCWNSTKCISIYDMCTDEEWCSFEHERKFCGIINEEEGMCFEENVEPELERHSSHKILCGLREGLKQAKEVFFTLTERKHRPAVLKPDPSENNVDFLLDRTYFTGNLYVAWFCNRGLFVWHWIGEEVRRFCFCPPAYYGHRCQFQSQRISLSYRMYTFEWRTVFNLVITLNDNTSQIHSQEQRIYLAIRDCDLQFDVNLLYSSRPKDASKTYTVRIDLFEKLNLKYRTTWEFPIKFSFLPVNPITTILTIPFESSVKLKNCYPSCIHGECLLYTNTRRPFCRCFQGWFGSSCERAHHCNCANGSVCIGSDYNNTICVCPLGKYGPRCLLTRSSCNPNPCSNGGLCVPADERVSEHDFSCICKQGYRGIQCDHEEPRITISFSDMAIPTDVFIHFITVVNDGPSLRATTLKKIAFDQDSVSLAQPLDYHIIFVQFFSQYYLAYIQPIFTPSASLNLPLFTSNRCSTAHKLFNSTIMKLRLIGRLKYYHIPCREQHDLKCFYDDVYMCLCSNERHANCFEFNYNMTYDCDGSSYCQNGAQCFQDHPTCPSSMMCVCDECFYGSRCQFTTKGFSLSLDTILGYQIRPRISLRRQPIAVKVSMVVTMIMLVLGLINGVISIMTFQSTKVREVGCGLYLLFSSIISMFTTVTFTLKFWIVVLAQKGTITNQSYLSFSCVTVDILLQVFLNCSEWLNAAVTVERAFTVIKGVTFDKKCTKRVSKVVIPALFGFTILTNIHDPLYRRLVSDIEEQRTWCTVSYPNHVQLFNWITKIFHVLAPFILNLTSATIIIMTISRKRSTAKRQTVYTEHLRKQLREHLHLLISPVILIILNLPRLIISFISGCMKSARNPWIFLIGYYISYVPSLLTFIVFVLSSDMYKQEFVGTVRQARTAIKRWLTIQ